MTNKLLTPIPAEVLPEVTLAIESFLADAITPVTAFERLRGTSQYAFLLESSEADSRLARFSIVGVDPKETLIFQNGQVQIIDHLRAITQPPLAEDAETQNAAGASSRGAFLAEDAETQNAAGASGASITNPLTFLEERTRLAAKPNMDLLPADLPFVAGYVGFLSYNAVSQFEHIPLQECDNLNVPDGIFSLFDALLVFDHKERTLHVISMRGTEQIRQLLEHIQLTPHNDTCRKLNSRIKVESPSKLCSGLNTSMSKNDFISKVAQCKQFIEEGQVFQIVLAQRFYKEFDGDAFDIYRALQSINPSPYGYFLQFPGFCYLGASPERLLSSRNGHLSLSALAGTRPRGANAEEELVLENDLRSDEKEMAEHMMLVDLGRNDLGRVATPGTVKCGEIARITRYGQVMHLTTDISAQLSDSASSFDAVRSCFPAGTVSGAPKIRAMELLSKVEPERRGIYSGLVGYFDLFGNMDSAIAIRSALVKDGKVHVTAGAGIVQDSIAENEYEETRNKAASVLKAVAMAEAMR